MGGLTRQAVMSAPLERVFSYVSDPRNAPHFISSITRIVSGPEGPPQQGGVWQAEVNFLGRRATVMLRLTELVPHQLVSFAIEGEPHATMTLRLVPRPPEGHTAVSLHLDVPSVPDIFLGGLMGGMLSTDMARLQGIMSANGR